MATLEDKRRIAYAALLRSSADVGGLREKALDNLVISALMGIVDEPHALKLGEIKLNISFAGSAARLRDAVVLQSLNRLTEAQKVIRAEDPRKKPVYYLSLKGLGELKQSVDFSAHVLDDVARHVLQNTSNIDFVQASDILRRFLCEAFARLGRDIAAGIVHRQVDDYHKAPALSDAFAAACEGHKLDAETREILSANCIEILRSKEPDAEKLKMYLARAFYFAEFLGVEGSGFDPLAADAFTGAIFYLDTNVVLAGLLPLGDESELFDEMRNVSKKVGATLRVTRATLNEARRAVYDWASRAKKIFESGLPVELAENTKDALLLAFLRLRAEDGQLTVEQFISPIDIPYETLSRHGVDVEEKTEQECVEGVDTAEYRKTIVASGLARNRPKVRDVLEHDVAHFALVSVARRQHAKTWFLTRDRTLLDAASRVTAQSQTPIVFFLANWLQSISPYLSASGELKLADFLSSYLTEQSVSPHAMFDIQELVLIAEKHADVFSAPPEKVVLAFDHVKRTFLQGRDYQAIDQNAVALEIRKYFVSQTSEKQRLLEEENRRLNREQDSISERLEDAVSERIAVAAKHELLSNEHAQLSQAVSALQSESEESKRVSVVAEKRILELEGRIAQQELTRSRFLAALLFLGGIIACALLKGFTGRIVGWLPTTWPRLRSLGAGGVRTLAAVLLAGSAFPFTRLLPLSSEFKVGVLTIVVAVALFVSECLTPEQFGMWSSVVQLASVAALIFVFWRRTPR